MADRSRSRRSFLSLAAAGTAAVAGCGGDAAEEQRGTPTALETAAVGREWTRGFGEATWLTARDGSVYFATGSGSLNNTARNAAVAMTPDGDVRWTQGFDSEPSRPIVVGNRLYLTHGERYVDARWIGDGGRRWRHDYADLFDDSRGSGDAAGEPVVLGDRLIVSLWEESADGRLLALDAATGEREWARAEERYWQLHGTADGALLRTSRGVLEAREPGNDRRWHVAFDGPVTATATRGDTVYATSEDDTLRAVDAATGEERWRVETRNEVRRAPLVTEDTIYVGGRDFFLRAIDRDGDERWRREFDGAVMAPVRVGNTIVAGSERRTLTGLDPADGSTRWTVDPASTDRTPSAPIRQLVAMDGGVFACYGGTFGNDLIQRLEVEG